jgi:malate synthase
MKSHVPYYDDFLSPELRDKILEDAVEYPGVNHLYHVGETGGLENKASMTFLRDLYLLVRGELNFVLNRRIRDRKFIDERTKAFTVFNSELKRDFLSPDYQTPMGLQDGDGRIVWGPRTPDYAHDKPSRKVAALPEFLQGPHVTLFGPPDNAKLSINAMNAYHRRLKDEPKIVSELLATHDSLPKWGADDEDSKTPLREDLISAGINLTGCLNRTITQDDRKLESDKLSLPIKRFPGLALPSTFLFYENDPIPLHLYDFALHFFENWHNEEALAFYVPKLENEEEARYIRIMLETAEVMIKRLHPEYKTGSIRLMIVLENPRAVFRAHEMMDELYPYFAGASLGWHDYLASTARLFKEDANYRIPVKADPDIVIKYIKASHDLLAQVVGPRGGIKIGGMYGILPINNDLKSDSFQITIKGYIRDVITQFKRDLDGFWVAHPDFVRLGLALVEAWKFHQGGDSSKLETLVTSLLNEKHHKEILDFIHGPDIEGMNRRDPMYARKLIVADIRESSFIANNHPDEIRYNVFQSLQYITDWLCGNGCVALPTHIGKIPARVMDDLATAERSRWEVWAELYHKRFKMVDFLKIAHEEMHFIRKDLSSDHKIVQVKWDERTSRWYPVAIKLMLKLMTDKNPVEFATELLLPFTLPMVREATDPWAKVLELDSKKYSLPDGIARFDHFFEMCGSLRFAKVMSKTLATPESQIRELILSFSKSEINEAATFHGNIGEGPKTLDKMAQSEQAKVFGDDDKIKNELIKFGDKYLQKFGMKFLISAQGKSGQEMLDKLKERYENDESTEIENARSALLEITLKRLQASLQDDLYAKIHEAFKRQKIDSAQVTLINKGHLQNLIFGKTTQETWFEMASLSKTVASAFAIEFFSKRGIPLWTPVNDLLKSTKSHFRIPNGDKVTLRDLMSHTALNMHYVNGVPADREMPPIRNFLEGNEDYKYPAIRVQNTPGEVFQYSGGGFIVLEHLLEAIDGISIFAQTRAFLNALGMTEFSFEQKSIPGNEYAYGHDDKDNVIEGTRKMFPAFAAGSMGTSKSMAKFLVHLENAYHDKKGSGPISHDTARLMLHGSDKGCMEFMGVKMGMGVFIGEAGENRFMIHQGANDGFRCIYLHTFAGPERGKGIVSLCNNDFRGVLFNAETTQHFLQELNFSGIDFSKFKASFDPLKISSEEIVNMGYKNLIFNAFHRPRPEPITDKGPVDPLSDYNLLAHAEILSVTNDLFASAENLISEHLPKFDPELFGKQGKVMDSWESVRHNPKGVDELVLKLPAPAKIRYVLLSTKYHLGNHSPLIRLEGRKDAKSDWVEFLPKTAIDGHSEIRIALSRESKEFSEIKVSMYPDGGFTRLGLFADIPKKEIANFKKSGSAKSIPYDEKIPHTKKPLSISFEASPEEIKTNLSTLKRGEEFNNASSAFGAKLIHASNEHYGPAIQVISPFGAINMFDGLESARSRNPGHSEEVVIALGIPLPIHRIEMDFTYFVNNNPLEVSVDVLVEGKWKSLIPKTNVKAFAGSEKVFEIQCLDVIQSVKVRTWPDGGMNRLRVFS